MARHRNVRGYNYDEDFEDDDLYGQSVEDDYCISPSTAAQFIYSRRDKPPSCVEPVEEEYDAEDPKESTNSISNHQLSGLDQARLYSCLDHMREVLGEAIPEQMMIDAVLRSKFDVEKALAVVLEQDRKLDLKNKSEEQVSSGEITKGDLFCSSEILVNNIKRFFPSLGNHSECADTSLGRCGPVAKDESLKLSDRMLRKVKKLDKPPCEKNLGLHRSSKEFPFSHEDPFGESPKNQAPVSLGAGCHSLYDPENKGVPSLESVMQQTAKSSSVLGRCLPAQSIPLFNSLESFETPLSLTNSLESLTLANKANLSENVPPVLQSSKQHLSSERHGVQISKCSPSLAELLQEPRQSNASQYVSLSDLCNQQATGFTPTSLGSSPLSQLAAHNQSSAGMPELTGSLSSLAFREDTSTTRDLESLSLSDLISKIIPGIDTCEKDPFLREVASFPAIDPTSELSALTQPVAESNTFISGAQVLSSDLGEQSGFSKENKKSKKGKITKKPALTFSWTKGLHARPSAFARTLCLRYPPKDCKRCPVDSHKTFLYSRQVQEVKDIEAVPLIAITPFDFKSASPDDIVKAKQKKAFVRE
ncbi:HBS1-like protein isoform X3 [Ornithorhynchus anatinus]|uniref:HBS1-like protein isoform X3 n=1 Tax=Ornithorhynchus anatinus TaxID=9258 RepID=UPI0000EDD98A|nr:HBS1-like protein isoform X3 [Ornithorhynchus anatinus]